MGRPSSYQPIEVLQRAAHLFRAKGFHAVSIDAIIEATGLNRFAIYEKFGGKEELRSRNGTPGNASGNGLDFGAAVSDDPAEPPAGDSGSRQAGATLMREAIFGSRCRRSA